MLYISIFGEKILGLSRYTLQTGGPALAGKIMHAQALVGGSMLAGADKAQPEGPVPQPDAICLMVHCASGQEAQRCFNPLTDGGLPLQRLTQHPPPDDGGMGALVQDKFGYK